LAVVLGSLPDNAQLKEALDELQQYFSDRLAPLMVADAMEVLLRYPASALAFEVRAWSAAQTASGLPIADLYYHAAKKVALMGEFNLAPVESLRTYVSELGRELLTTCPEVDRDLLAGNLEALGQLKTLAGEFGGGSLQIVHRSGAPAAAAAAATGEPVGKGGTGMTAGLTKGLKRLSMLFERLKPQASAQQEQRAEQRAEVASQIVTAAVSQSTSEKELEEHLAPLRQYGIEPAMDKIFRALATTLPGWGALPGAGEGGGPTLVGSQVNAMRQIVSLAEDPAESASRFRELVQSAVEQFNDGYLGRAVTMFEVADRLAADGKVQTAFLDPIRKNHQALSAERLRKYVDRGDTRASVRAVLNFYYALRPDGLLDALNGESRRDRRHELLSMLEVHGTSARSLARERLEASVPDPDADPFFQMNLVYLLRVIVRPEDVSLDDEVGVVIATTGRESPAPLVKQVIAYLANVRHEKCEKALITYLRVFESMLLQPETSTYTTAEVETLLDRTCAGLARYATPRAWRALVDHGLKTEVRLGSPTARLVEAGKQDLSGTPELVDRLIMALKAELPKSVLGFTVKKNNDRIVWLVQALSGTGTDQVRATLQDIADRFPGETFTETVAKTIASLGVASKPPSAPASLAGDLELFGLPSLMQTLSQSSLTGALSLLNKEGRAEAMILFEKGQFRGAQYGPIKAARAVYQLFERPFPGTFAFVYRTDIAALGPNSPPRDIVGIVLEGVRRHDELKQAAVMVPDDAVLTVTETPHTDLSDEDPALARIIWDKVTAGGSAQKCEASVAVDAYHVRRLLAHWVEEGALSIN
jgi:hypothetical protein